MLALSLHTVRVLVEPILDRGAKRLTRKMDNLQKQKLQRFLTIQQQKMAMQENLMNITECCWDKCMGVPGNRLDSRTESCIRDCTQRLVDSSNYISNRFSIHAQKASLPDPLH